MVIIESCCCCSSLRIGSFVSSIYTMLFYAIIVTAGSFHVNSILEDAETGMTLFIFSILMLIFAALSIMTSVVLFVGICLENRNMLLPWIVCLTINTVLDIILSIYLICDSKEIDPFTTTLMIIDYIVCALNIYCILCVASQYQCYSSGPRVQGSTNNNEVRPVIQFEAASTIRPKPSPSRMVSISIIRNNGSPASTICRPLLSSSGSSAARTTVSSNLIASSSPAFMLSRSSFSSTSEISFGSSDLLSSSRRSSALPSQEIQKPGLSPVGEVNSFPSLSDEPSTAEAETEGTQADINVTNSRDSLPVSRLLVSGKFSSMNFMPKLTKMEIPKIEVQSAENVPIQI